MAGLYKNIENVKENDNEEVQKAIADKINEESEKEEKSRAKSYDKYTDKYLEARKEYEEEKDKGNVDVPLEIAGESDFSERARKAHDTMIDEELKQEAGNKRHTRRANKIAKARSYQKAQNTVNEDSSKISEMDDEEFTKKYNKKNG